MPENDLAAPAGTMGNARRRAVRLLSALGLLSFSFMFLFVAAEASGLATVNVVGSPDDPPPSAEARQGAAAPQEAVHVAGALAVVAMGATGLIGLLTRPNRSGSGYQVLAAAAGLLVVLPVVGDSDNVGGQALVFDPAMAVLALPALAAGLISAPWRSGRRPLVRPMIVPAVLGGVTLIVYAVDQALMQRNTFPPSADPHHQAHWLAMAAFGAVAALVVSTAILRSDGWRLAAGCGAGAVLVVSLVSIAQPQAASSFGLLGGVAGMAWAAVVGAIAVWPAATSDALAAPAPIARS